MKPILWMLLALWPWAGLADEADIADLLMRVKQAGTAEFRYQETRVLELAASPWQGQGYMYSGADGSLVKLQLQPKRAIMAIVEGRQMVYFDPQEKQRHSAPVSQAGPAAAQITLFRAILQGHAEELKPAYDFAAKTQGKQWTLTLTPKPDPADEDAPTVEIAGGEDERMRRILIRQGDGESTEYRMVKTGEGSQLDASIQRLLLEAVGK